MLHILSKADKPQQRAAKLDEKEREASLAPLNDPEIKILRTNANRLLKSCEAMMMASPPDAADRLATVRDLAINGIH
jgi:hypothetical protein